MTTSRFLLPRLEYRYEWMSEIDKVNWISGISFSSYGVRVGIRVNDDSLMPDVLSSLPPLWTPDRNAIVDYMYSLQANGDKGFHTIYSGPLRTLRTRSLDKALRHLERSVEFTVATASPDRLFVHAGVVGWHGRAIVLPGRTMSGKSSMVAALLRAGATYYSDEFAVLDPAGRVYPYPRPLQLRKTNQQKKVLAKQLGARTGRRPLPVGLVASLRYKRGGIWEPQILSPAEAAMELLNNTVMAQYLTNLATLKAAVAPAIALKSKRGEANHVAKALMELLRKPVALT